MVARVTLLQSYLLKMVIAPITMTIQPKIAKSTKTSFTEKTKQVTESTSSSR